MKKICIKLVVLLGIGLLTGINAKAQWGPTPPGSPPEETIMNNPNSVPVDGGIGLILAAGVALYSRKKLIQHKKENVIN